ncbi:MAG: HEAT repeat domain-containing protein, partial [Deltaproteobacteria bacterium]|nr:HEAT repeat domain-containing protein [Deltaproteobacteria bacterium]
AHQQAQAQAALTEAQRQAVEAATRNFQNGPLPQGKSKHRRTREAVELDRIRKIFTEAIAQDKEEVVRVMAGRPMRKLIEKIIDTTGVRIGEDLQLLLIQQILDHSKTGQEAWDLAQRYLRFAQGLTTEGKTSLALYALVNRPHDSDLRERIFLELFTGTTTVREAIKEIASRAPTDIEFEDVPTGAAKKGVRENRSQLDVAALMKSPRRICNITSDPLEKEPIEVLNKVARIFLAAYEEREGQFRAQELLGSERSIAAMFLTWRGRDLDVQVRNRLVKFVTTHVDVSDRVAVLQHCSDWLDLQQRLDLARQYLLGGAEIGGWFASSSLSNEKVFAADLVHALIEGLESGNSPLPLMLGLPGLETAQRSLLINKLLTHGRQAKAEGVESEAWTTFLEQMELADKGDLLNEEDVQELLQLAFAEEPTHVRGELDKQTATARDAQTAREKDVLEMPAAPNVTTTVREESNERANTPGPRARVFSSRLNDVDNPFGYQHEGMLPGRLEAEMNGAGAANPFDPHPRGGLVAPSDFGLMGFMGEDRFSQPPSAPSDRSTVHRKLPTWGDLNTAAPTSDTRNNVEARENFVKRYAWAVPTQKAIEAIAKFVGKEEMLEVGAGRGLWAALLKKQDARVIATDGFRTHDVRRILPSERAAQTYTDVEPLSHWRALETHPETKVLLMIWPPKDEMAFEALGAFQVQGGEKFIFVGEAQRGGANGDDRFFKILDEDWEVVEEVDIPNWLDTRDHVVFYRRKRATTSDPHPQDLAHTPGKVAFASSDIASDPTLHPQDSVDPTPGFLNRLEGQTGLASIDNGQGEGGGKTVGAIHESPAREGENAETPPLQSKETTGPHRELEAPARMPQMPWMQKSLAFFYGHTHFVTEFLTNYGPQLPHLVSSLLNLSAGTALSMAAKPPGEVGGKEPASPEHSVEGAVDPKVTANIAALREDKDPEVRASSAQALGRLGDARVVEPLMVAFLGNEDSWVRRMARDALETCEKRQFEGRLTPDFFATGTPHRQIRLAVWKAVDAARVESGAFMVFLNPHTGEAVSSEDPSAVRFTFEVRDKKLFLQTTPTSPYRSSSSSLSSVEQSVMALNGADVAWVSWRQQAELVTRGRGTTGTVAEMMSSAAAAVFTPGHFARLANILRTAWRKDRRETTHVRVELTPSPQPSPARGEGEGEVEAQSPADPRAARRGGPGEGGMFSVPGAGLLGLAVAMHSPVLAGLGLLSLVAAPLAMATSREGPREFFHHLGEVLFGNSYRGPGLFRRAAAAISGNRPPMDHLSAKEAERRRDEATRLPGRKAKENNSLPLGPVYRQSADPAHQQAQAQTALTEAQRQVLEECLEPGHPYWSEIHYPMRLDEDSCLIPFTWTDEEQRNHFRKMFANAMAEGKEEVVRTVVDRRMWRLIDKIMISTGMTKTKSVKLLLIQQILDHAKTGQEALALAQRYLLFTQKLRQVWDGHLPQEGSLPQNELLLHEVYTAVFQKGGTVRETVPVVEQILERYRAQRAEENRRAEKSNAHVLEFLRKQTGERAAKERRASLDYLAEKIPRSETSYFYSIAIHHPEDFGTQDIANLIGQGNSLDGYSRYWVKRVLYPLANPAKGFPIRQEIARILGEMPLAEMDKFLEDLMSFGRDDDVPPILIRFLELEEENKKGYLSEALARHFLKHQYPTAVMENFFKATQASQSEAGRRFLQRLASSASDLARTPAEIEAATWIKNFLQSRGFDVTTQNPAPAQATTGVRVRLDGEGEGEGEGEEVVEAQSPAAPRAARRGGPGGDGVFTVPGAGLLGLAVAMHSPVLAGLGLLALVAAPLAMVAIRKGPPSGRVLAAFLLGTHEKLPHDAELRDRVRAEISHKVAQHRKDGKDLFYPIDVAGRHTELGKTLRSSLLCHFVSVGDTLQLSPEVIDAVRSYLEQIEKYTDTETRRKRAVLLAVLDIATNTNPALQSRMIALHNSYTFRLTEAIMAGEALIFPVLLSAWAVVASPNRFARLAAGVAQHFGLEANPLLSAILVRGLAKYNFPPQMLLWMFSRFGISRTPTQMDHAGVYRTSHPAAPMLETGLSAQRRNAGQAFIKSLARGKDAIAQATQRNSISLRQIVEEALAEGESRGQNLGHGLQMNRKIAILDFLKSREGRQMVGEAIPKDDYDKQNWFDVEFKTLLHAALRANSISGARRAILKYRERRELVYQKLSRETLYSPLGWYAFVSIIMEALTAGRFSVEDLEKRDRRLELDPSIGLIRIGLHCWPGDGKIGGPQQNAYAALYYAQNALSEETKIANTLRSQVSPDALRSYLALLGNIPLDSLLDNTPFVQVLLGKHHATQFPQEWAGLVRNIRKWIEKEKSEGRDPVLAHKVLRVVVESGALLQTTQDSFADAEVAAWQNLLQPLLQDKKFGNLHQAIQKILDHLDADEGAALKEFLKAKKIAPEAPRRVRIDTENNDGVEEEEAAGQSTPAIPTVVKRGRGGSAGGGIQTPLGFAAAGLGMYLHSPLLTAMGVASALALGMVFAVRTRRT